MKTSPTLAEMLEESGLPPEPGYEEWKLEKIRRGQAEAKDRSKMIPAEQVWRELGLEG